MFCSKEMVTGGLGERVGRASISESDDANQIINIQLSQLVELEKSQSNCEGRLSEKEKQINDLKLWKDLEGQIAVLEEYKSESEARVDGGWGNWSSWSSCSVSCGEGTQYRTRPCDSPSPSNSGAYCQGEPFQNQNCLTNRCWIKVFSHDVSGGLFEVEIFYFYNFTQEYPLQSDADALSKNGDDPSALLFSRLDQLEILRREDGKFRFKIVYPGLGGSNEWMQTSNLATSNTIEGYEPVNIEYKVQGHKDTWRGLGLCTGNNNAFICDTPKTGYWWMCVGCRKTYQYPDTIPGPWRDLTKKVELYVQL